jgi:hypothetical protein
MKKTFVDAPNMSPKQEYYRSQIVSVDNIKENEKLEIKASEPIQVRINNGPWQDIRPLQ